MTAQQRRMKYARLTYPRLSNNRKTSSSNRKLNKLVIEVVVVLVVLVVLVVVLGVESWLVSQFIDAVA
jgi:NADH:ubiquinone oxidoreductase subunit 4 (subunit M)